MLLESASDQNTFLVQVVWTPADIGSENNFEIHFIEPETLKEVEDVVYDFTIEQDGEPVFTNEDQDSNLQTVTFDKPGPYTIVVSNIEGLGENASFTVEVTPEFPFGILVGLVAVMGGAILVTRLHRNDLFRFWNKY